MITQLEVDGVPALLSPSTGATAAGLVFRVGLADETLARRGITHLVEHLALHSVGSADYHYNGVTGVEHTSFHVQGSADDVAAFVTGICAGLRSLPMDRLAAEKNILRTEASGRAAGLADAMPLWRHGARDHGMPSYPEWGLPALTEPDLVAWVARYFTRENAALWVTGDAVPAGLRLDLPGGERRPAPAVSAALPRTPAYFAGQSTAVVWDTEVVREPGAAVFANVLEHRMFRELRRESGLSYQVETAYEPRCGGTARITAVADALPEHAPAVLGGVLDILASVRLGQTDPDDVRAVLKQAADGLAEAEERGARLPGQAVNLLCGRPVQSLEEALAELRAVTADRVAEIGAAAHAAGLLMTPAGTDAAWAGYEAAPSVSAEAVDGVTYPARKARDARLVVGPEGVSVVDPDGPLTVRYDACSIALGWPDGGRRLIGHDATVVAVEPTHYRGGAAAVRELDARMPAAVRVSLPPRDPERIPRPAQAPKPARRFAPLWWRRLARAQGSPSRNT